MGWSVAREKLLRKLWARGDTIDAMAAELGVSRGMIAGKLDRLGLHGVGNGGAGQRPDLPRRYKGLPRRVLRPSRAELRLRLNEQ